MKDINPTLFDCAEAHQFGGQVRHRLQMGTW